MARIHVCAQPGCPELAPCPHHSRPAGASWSDRDNTQQVRWARAVKARDDHRCQQCGSPLELVAHHVRPGWDLEDGITLCKRHHREVDQHAR